MATPEQEAIVRAVKRTCRGRIGSKVYDGSFIEEKKADLEKYLRGLITAVLVEDRVADAHAIDNGSRLPCGYDFNETILAGPLDGQEYDYECPGCGVKGSYRAPLFV